MSRRQKIVDIECELAHETDEALLIYTDDGAEVWLPKSAIEYENDGNSVIVISMPESLAIKKGLV